MELPAATSSPKRAGLSMLLGAPQPIADMPTEGASAGDAVLAPTAGRTTRRTGRAATPKSAAPTRTGLLHLRLDDIHRNEAQPRTVFDSDAIVSLATSIEASGVIQPIAVRRRPEGGWQIIAGERRWLAARRAGLATIPAVEHYADDQQTLVLALVENLVREDLSPLETARAYAALQDEFGMSISELARSVGRSRPAVSNTLRLLELPDVVLDMLERRVLTEGHGRALLGCSDRLRLQKLAKLSLDRSLTVRALERLVREQETSVAGGSEPRRFQRSKWNIDPDHELVERVERLAEGGLGVRGRVKLGDGGAKLELVCDDPAALVDLVARLEVALAVAR